MATRGVTQMQSHSVLQSPSHSVWARGHWGFSVPAGHSTMLLLMHSLGMSSWGQGEETDEVGLTPTRGG